MSGTEISAMIRDIVIMVPGFLVAITVHEYTHGRVALAFGDPTAKLAGRLTFNPVSHLDLFGTIVLVATAMTGFAIGWAKPVPVDPRYLRRPRADMMWISLGGPAANLVAATLCAFIFHAIIFFFEGKPVGEGSYFFLQPLVRIVVFAVQINVVLAIFNLIPVAPLDGSKILAGILPRELAYHLERLEPYGFIILILLLFTGVVGYIIIPPIRFITGLLLGMVG